MMLPGGGRGQQDFFLSTFWRLGALPLGRCQNGIGEGGSSPEGEPSDQVITQRRPSGFQGCLQAAATTELAQAAAFLNPGVGKLGDARAFAVNLLGFFRGHLGLERRGCSGFLAACNRPDPGGTRFLRGALRAQGTASASLPRGAIDLDANPVGAVQRRRVSQGFSRRASEAILPGIIGEGAG